MDNRASGFENLNRARRKAIRARSKRLECMFRMTGKNHSRFEPVATNELVQLPCHARTHPPRFDNHQPGRPPGCRGRGLRTMCSLDSVALHVG